MATKKEINAWLKESGYTSDSIDKFWSECCEVNWKCKMIRNSGKNWTDMTMYQIKQLPTLKETTLKQLKEKEDKERAEKLKEFEEERKKKYYEDNFEKIMLNKILNKESLSESELQRLLDFELTEERDYGENRRWTRTVYSVISLFNTTFMLEWEQGLTESQENAFYTQPYEVEPFEKEVVMVVKEWKRK